MENKDEEFSAAKCACKGIRTCPACEATGKLPQFAEKKNPVVYTYCVDCSKAWKESINCHPDHAGDSLEFPGIFIQRNFIDAEEEDTIAKEIYKTPFVDSQSGRRKQDFGPKVNFKRKKVKAANFTGLPAFSKDLYHRMLTCDRLASFVPVEQCHLEYTPERGSSIDPHFDDFWLWGERLVTVNLLSDTILYFVCDQDTKLVDFEVQVPMYRRCLIVVYGEARSKWKHAIHRSDIKDKRLAITLRELSPEFTEGGTRSDEGKALLDIALSFTGQAIGS